MGNRARVHLVVVPGYSNSEITLGSVQLCLGHRITDPGCRARVSIAADTHVIMVRKFSE